MQTIKKRDFSEIGKSLFSLNRYKKHLVILENNIAFELSIRDPKLYQKQGKSDIPYQYHLRVDDTELWFGIEWEKGRNINYYLIANPQYLSVPHQFLCQISNAKAGEIIKVSARSASDLIERLNLSGEIKKIFFGKSSTREVKFNGPHILGEVTNGVDVTRLMKGVLQLHQKYHSSEPLSFPLSEAAV